MRSVLPRQVAFFGLLLLRAVGVSGKIARTTLANLVASSDVIVVATDAQIRESHGFRVAEASVEQVLKGGTELKRVWYVADPSWSCDTAEARVGEKAVLFLSIPRRGEGGLGRRPPRRLDGEQILSIAGAGRGRMPVRTIDAAPYATLGTVDIELPASLITVPGPEPEYDFIESVP